MRITVAEVVELSNEIQEITSKAKREERERGLGIMQDEQHKMNVRVKQCAERLIAQGQQPGLTPEQRDAILGAATEVRDMLDDRPPPESDPDTAKRFPSMFRGGPV